MRHRKQEEKVDINKEKQQKKNAKALLGYLGAAWVFALPGCTQLLGARLWRSFHVLPGFAAAGSRTRLRVSGAWAGQSLLPCARDPVKRKEFVHLLRAWQERFIGHVARFDGKTRPLPPLAWEQMASDCRRDRALWRGGARGSTACRPIGAAAVAVTSATATNQRTPQGRAPSQSGLSGIVWLGAASTGFPGAGRQGAYRSGTGVRAGSGQRGARNRGGEQRGENAGLQNLAYFNIN
ncbi:uncharacterized protein LOC128787483 [Vidua chalybeata]|uniref:uncharacterized protein LOC128787483 n=1 Tax=Vidua chalybeata TaxID=81927 RepID=UPI0023A8ECB0|nr:uncharacterized protein LOC128787483 [Vidua chalybeata]